MRRFACRRRALRGHLRPERTGLENDDVALADAVLTVPLNPEFTSLNLGQAVLVTAYEWFRAGDATPPAEVSMPGRTRPATHAELENFFAHLERELDAGGFLRVVEKRPIMVRNLRNLFLRAGLTEKELRALHGVITSLAGRRRGEPEAECGGRRAAASAAEAFHHRPHVVRQRRLGAAAAPGVPAGDGEEHGERGGQRHRRGEDAGGQLGSDGQTVWRPSSSRPTLRPAPAAIEAVAAAPAPAAS